MLEEFPPHIQKVIEDAISDRKKRPDLATARDTAGPVSPEGPPAAPSSDQPIETVPAKTPSDGEPLTRPDTVPPADAKSGTATGEERNPHIIFRTPKEPGGVPSWRKKSSDYENVERVRQDFEQVFQLLDHLESAADQESFSKAETAVQRELNRLKKPPLSAEGKGIVEFSILFGRATYRLEQAPKAFEGKLKAEKLAGEDKVESKDPLFADYEKARKELKQAQEDENSKGGRTKAPEGDLKRAEDEFKKARKELLEKQPDKFEVLRADVIEDKLGQIKEKDEKRWGGLGRVGKWFGVKYGGMSERKKKVIAWSMIAVGAAATLGSSLVAMGAYKGIAYTFGVSSIGIGGYNLFSQKVREWSRGKIEKSLDSIKDLDAQKKLKDLQESIARLEAQGYFDGKDYAQIQEDGLMKKLMSARDKALKELAGRDDFISTLEAQLDEANVALDSKVTSEKGRRLIRRIMAGGVIVGTANLAQAAQELADQAAELLGVGEYVGEYHPEPQGEQPPPIEEQPKSPADSPPIQEPAGPPAAPGTGDPGRLVPLGEPVEIKYNDGLTNARFDKMSDGSLNIHIGGGDGVSRGIEGALLDLQNAAPEEYKGLIEKLENQYPDIKGDGALIHKFAEDYKLGDLTGAASRIDPVTGHSGLDDIHGAEITIGKDGMPEITHVDYMHKTAPLSDGVDAGVAEAGSATAETTDPGIDTAFQPSSNPTLGEFLREGDTGSDGVVPGASAGGEVDPEDTEILPPPEGPSLESAADAGGAQSGVAGSGDSEKVVSILDARSAAEAGEGTAEVFSAASFESGGKFSVPELSEAPLEAMNQDYQDLYFKNFLGLDAEKLAGIKTSKITVQEFLLDVPADASQLEDLKLEELKVKYGDIPKELPDMIKELEWTQEKINTTSLYDALIEYAKHWAKTRLHAAA